MCVQSQLFRHAGLRAFTTIAHTVGPSTTNMRAILVPTHSGTLGPRGFRVQGPTRLPPLINPLGSNIGIFVKFIKKRSEI